MCSRDRVQLFHGLASLEEGLTCANHNPSAIDLGPRPAPNPMSKTIEASGINTLMLTTCVVGKSVATSCAGFNLRGWSVIWSWWRDSGLTIEGGHRPWMSAISTAAVTLGERWLMMMKCSHDLDLDALISNAQVFDMRLDSPG